MLKLTLCLIAAFATAVVMLQLRQQRLNLNFQVGRLHNQIEARQARLWNQQLQIASYTAPNAIAKVIGEHKLDLTSRAPIPAGHADWMGAGADLAVDDNTPPPSAGAPVTPE
jgi:hypothetical protein